MDILNIFKNESFLTVLKWTGTILVAGFIGQFGRRFAEHLIDRGKKRRETRRLKKIPGKEPVPAAEKSQGKEVKASLPGEETPVAPPAPDRGKITPEIIEEMAKAKKKEKKALAKVEKKRLKAEKKLK